MPNKLLFKEQDENLFRQYWQEILDMTGAGPRYSPFTMKMFDLIAKARSIFQADKSFVYLQNGKPAAAVYLPILKVNGEMIASVPGDYIYAPLVIDQMIEKELFSEIDKIAQEFKVSKIEFQVDPMEDQISYNYLQKYNYLESSILAYLIDLTVDDFLASCRKGHRNEIKKILADPEVEIFHTDGEKPDHETHEQYRELHRKMAGRATRPKETFDLQFERLKAGEAVLFTLKHRGQVAAMTYFDFRGSKANYASSVHDPDIANQSFGHALVYSAALYLKPKGVKLIDSEQPSAPSSQFGFPHDQKQLNIALFKRGFGGRYAQNFRGVKYFSRTALEKDFENFTKQY